MVEHLRDEGCFAEFSRKQTESGGESSTEGCESSAYLTQRHPDIEDLPLLDLHLARESESKYRTYRPGFRQDLVVIV